MKMQSPVSKKRRGSDDASKRKSMADSFDFDVPSEDEGKRNKAP
jgi:hypothetical protein